MCRYVRGEGSLHRRHASLKRRKYHTLGGGSSWLKSSDYQTSMTTKGRTPPAMLRVLPAPIERRNMLTEWFFPANSTMTLCGKNLRGENSMAGCTNTIATVTCPASRSRESYLRCAHVGLELGGRIFDDFCCLFSSRTKFEFELGVVAVHGVV